MDKCISYGYCKGCFCWTEKGCYIPWIDGDSEPPSDELLEIMFTYQDLLSTYQIKVNRRGQ